MHSPHRTLPPRERVVNLQDGFVDASRRKFFRAIKARQEAPVILYTFPSDQKQPFDLCLDEFKAMQIKAFILREGIRRFDQASRHAYFVPHAMLDAIAVFSRARCLNASEASNSISIGLCYCPV